MGSGHTGRQTRRSKVSLCSCSATASVRGVNVQRRKVKNLWFADDIDLLTEIEDLQQQTTKWKAWKYKELRN
jgi:hypothetical protein